MIIYYKKPVGKLQVDRMVGWLEEYIGSEYDGWDWHEFRITIADEYEAEIIMFRLKFGV